MEELKVGDTVKVVKLADSDIADGFDIGTIGVITKINRREVYSYQVINEIGFDVFKEEELLKVEKEKVVTDRVMNIEDMKGLTNNEFLSQEMRKILRLPKELTEQDIEDILEGMEYSDIEKYQMFVGAIMLGNPIEFEEFKYFKNFSEWFETIDTINILGDRAGQGKEISVGDMLPMDFVELSNGGLYVLDDDIRGV